MALSPGRRPWVPGLLAGLAIAGLAPLGMSPQAIAQTSAAACPQPVLSRLTRHRVAPGETLTTIAQRYSLLPATIMGLNASTQGGTVSPGQELLIPPYNGIRASVTPGQTWEQVAQAYNSRADVLFEVNGCVGTVPTAIFVPGVNWFPGVRTTAAAAPAERQSPLQGYPLPSRSQVIVNYGWQPDPAQGKLVFNTGVALASPVSTPVLAVGPGTVAFAGSDSVYGNLVVINHPQGLQTRYANLDALEVRAGQTVRQGDRLGPVAPRASDDESFVFFEVRLNSAMGWVAQDPQNFVPAMVLR
ncbi:M23 family metallopeptidase [Nodosilinea sp. LEGE 06152]|uniref:LysM peptidoglycan-binding domain-containing M23 family metallopeptidase n=1 Tax=Nodosilinea sp. LEGE 06152 TaxID=2777966 RepID=UPI001D143CB5|nr:M23 family metallopeptidase [Nodosilinea sp. LEGE 06152]